jgi:aspartyl-tRNA(Asn)/glutamyl-tRNA(Gln) amidotransferase subunit A
VRTLIKEDFDHCFEKVDVIVGPTTPTTAFKLGEKSNSPLEMYLGDMYTIPANIAGLPALSLTAGLAQGLPVGFQIIGKQWDEAHVLNAGNILEKALDLSITPDLSGV